ncbi:podocin [Myripristis murdjan]|uniref:podocin n=1 Tax=Myripristis murdjan TaxID=586833 RepID=UPI001175F6C4|nr:podocin-like [Myripristis murdjan]
MEKTPRPKTSRRERETETLASPKGHPPRASSAGRLPEASAARRERPRKEKSGTKELKMEKDVKVKSTVVDVDNVRVDEEKEQSEENLGLLEVGEQEDGVKHRNLGVFEWLLMVFVLTLVLCFLPLSIWFCVKVVREHERAVIFRLGHLLRGRPRGPGLLFYLPFLDVCQKVDIRLKMLKVPPHTVVTKDLLRPELSSVCYYRVENVALCSTAVSSLTSVLQTLVQAAARDVLAQHKFTHIQLDRRRLGQQIQAAADSVACRWGVRVERTDIEELSLPAELQQSLAAEAETRRQDHVKVKAADGERAAWEAFRAYLHLLHPTLVLPLPSDFLSLTPDLSPLPPPPPPPPPPTTEEEMREGEQIREGESGTDSPMM